MKKNMAVIFFCLMIAFCAAMFWGCDDEEPQNTQQESVTITAEVTDINGTVITLRGLTEGFGSDYTLDISEIAVCREGEEHIAAEVEVGDKLSVTFSGIALKNYPGTLQKVSKVIKLNG